MEDDNRVHRSELYSVVVNLLERWWVVKVVPLC